MATSTRLTLNDVCLAIVDCEHKTAPTQPEGHPSIRTPNVGCGRLILEGVNRVSDETYRQWTQRMEPMGGDLILAREAPIGNVAIIPKGLNVCLGQRTVLIRADRTKVLPEYLVYLMLGDEIQGRILSQSNGATVHHLNMKDIRALALPPLPSIEEQHRVASILSAYDDLIENNTRRIAILEEMTRRIYEEWFVRFRFLGHEGVRMVESELGLVPKGWSVATVADVTDTLGGGTPSKSEPNYWTDGHINWYSPTDLTGAKTIFMEESSSKITGLGLAKSSARLFPLNSVMMTSRATIGVIAINTTAACTNQGFITCIPSVRFPLWLLFHWLKANVGTFESLGTGATFKEITKGVFRKIKLVVPPSTVVAIFEKIVAPMMDLVLCLERKNRNLRTTRDLLLPKLISGELDVSALPEPEEAVAV